MTNISNDLTIVHYTANVIHQGFAIKTWDSMFYAALANSKTTPIISVSHKPLPWAVGKTILVDLPRSHFSIYRQALIGAQAATTKYIGLAEDDVLYSLEHFKYRPKHKPFAYNLGYWGIYTWQDPPIYNYKGRRNLGNLICEREAFIEAMQERFAKYPDPQGDVLKDIWAEPSKYERQLGVTTREAEDFYSQPPNIKFSHETELSFAGLGTRKRAGELRALDVPYWGKASEIRALYD